MTKNFRQRKKNIRGRITKRHHANLEEEEEEEEEEPPKKLAKEEIEEYILFFALSGSMTPGNDTWLNDSGASKHMTCHKKTLSSLEENDSP